MKQLVITGSSGFVGRRLVEVALSRGFAVIGVDLASTESLRCKQFALNLNSENIAHLIPEGATVIHLASLSTDSQCRQNPTLALESNLAATLNYDLHMLTFFDLPEFGYSILVFKSG